MIPMQPWEIEAIRDLSSQREQLKLRDLAQDATAAKWGAGIGVQVCLPSAPIVSIMCYAISNSFQDRIKCPQTVRLQVPAGYTNDNKKSNKIVLLMVR